MSRLTRDITFAAVLGLECGTLITIVATWLRSPEARDWILPLMGAIMVAAARWMGIA